MGRPKTLNPLAIAFGAALRIQRLRQDTSTDEAAKAAGLSSTFFRLIESGRNHIAVGKAPVLHAAFDKQLNYEAITFFLSTIAALEDPAAEVQDPKERGQRLSQQAAAIGAALGGDHAFRIFLKKFTAPLNTFPISVPKSLGVGSNIFDAVTLPADELRTLVAGARLDQEAADLLTGYAGYGAGDHQIDQDYPEQFFSDIPTLYKELFDGLKRSILGFPPTFAPEVSWEWEKKNYETFEELFVVCQWKQLVAVKNLTRYKFDYLWEKHFKRAVFILLDAPPNRTPEALKAEFWTNLPLGLQARADGNSDEQGEKQVALKLLSTYNTSKKTLQNKTIFCPCPNEEIKQKTLSLFSERGPEDHRPNAIWFFRTTDKAFIGAASHIDPQTVKATHIVFLTFSQCGSALGKLNRIFPNLL